MTVKDLKEIIKYMHDDMPVIIPVIDYNDANYIEGFRHVRTAGILLCEYEDNKRAFCLNASANNADLKTQLGKYRGDVTCENVLF